jgi:hypothetical protein
MRPGEDYNPEVYPDVPTDVAAEPAVSERDRLRAEVAQLQSSDVGLRQLAYALPPGMAGGAAPAAAPTAMAIPGRRTIPGQMGATEPEINAAVGQLNAGQPVTALPIQAWSLDQQRAWNDKLTQYDRQAAATKMAAEQAARDAAMLDQMSRVAKSTKDIEVAMQQVDVNGFTRWVGNGGNPVVGLTHFPRAATAPLVAAMKEMTPAPPPKLVNLPGGISGVQSGTRGEDFKFTPSATVGMPVAEKYINLADQEAAVAEKFRQSGDTENYQLHNDRAENYRALAAPRVSSTNVRFDESGKPIVEMSTGPKPTTAMTTKAQEKTVQYEDALSLINQLEKSLAPSDVGAAGLIGEMVLDRTLPQFGVEQYFSGARVKKRVALGALRESLLRQVSDDTRFSNADRKEIQKILPSTGIFESQPDALYRMEQVKEILQDRIRAYSGATGASAPASVKTRETIVNEYNAGVNALTEAVKSNRMTPEQAHQRALELHKQMTEAVRRFH